jgi:hypothetical protein
LIQIAFQIRVESQTRNALDKSRVWQEPFLVAQQTDKEEVITLLSALARDHDLKEEVVAMSEEDFTSLAKLSQKVRTFRERLPPTHPFVLSQTLGLCEKGSSRHQKLLAGLHELLACRGSILPCAELASGEVARVGSFPVTGTSNFDLWEGLWLGKEKVVLKVLRGVSMGPSARRVSVDFRLWSPLTELHLAISPRGGDLEAGLEQGPWKIHYTFLWYLLR